MIRKLAYAIPLLVLSSTALWADEVKEDMGKAPGPCRAKVEELQNNRKKLRDCLQEWIKAAKTGSADPTDDCTEFTKGFVAKAKEIKACRASNKSNE